MASGATHTPSPRPNTLSTRHRRDGRATARHRRKYAHRSIRAQVALVPIVKGMDKDPEGTQTVMSLVDKVVDECESMGIRVKVDDRENMRPGAKYFEWERKGAPLRLEVGPRDAAQNVMVVASRLGGEKQTIAVDEVPSYLKQRLDEMQVK